jgi:hypothetical protein
MVNLAPQAALLAGTTAGIGVLMVFSGVGKSLLEWRPRRRCPSCGRYLDGRSCRCTG